LLVIVVTSFSGHHVREALPTADAIVRHQARCLRSGRGLDHRLQLNHRFYGAATETPASRYAPNA
jgi:hypothetical protein